LSADRADGAARLSRLVGQHPAAIRTVVWRTEPLAPEEFGHLEIETKHGYVFVIDHVTGAVYSNPPAPPDTDAPRQFRDLTGRLRGAFDGRPTFAGVTPSRTGYEFALSTGAGFSLTLDDRSPRISPDNE
jgi:hypothetical protein